MDDYTKHEALHMALFLAESVESQLLDNEFVQDNPELKVLADEANKILLDMYQKIGV